MLVIDLKRNGENTNKIKDHQLDGLFYYPKTRKIDNSGLHKINVIKNRQPSPQRIITPSSKFLSILHIT